MGYFFGVEKIDITVKRSIIVRLSSVLCILFFVKEQSALWIYTIIMVGSTVISNMILFKYLNKIIDVKAVQYVTGRRILSHIKPNLMLFIPLLAMSVYRTMDKTMLGVLSSYNETGYYYNADKVINIPFGIINGIGTVMLPRMTSLIESRKIKESDNVFNISLEMMVALSVAMAGGLAAVSTDFVPIFLGKEFEPCINLLFLFAPVMVIKALSQTSRMLYLIPNHLENIFLQSVCAGMITNIIVNALLIKKYGAIGAVVGTLVAETVTCFWQYYRMRQYIPFIQTLLKSLSYVVFGGIMYCMVRVVAMQISHGLICLITEIVVGGVTYMGLCFIYWKTANNDILLTVSRGKNDNKSII